MLYAGGQTHDTSYRTEPLADDCDRRSIQPLDTSKATSDKLLLPSIMRVNDAMLASTCVVAM